MAADGPNDFCHGLLREEGHRESRLPLRNSHKVGTVSIEESLTESEET